MLQSSCTEMTSLFVLYELNYNLHFLICVSRWYWRSDGSLHRSQHPHYSRTLWLSIWGTISLFKTSPIIIGGLSLRLNIQCNVLIMKMCTAPVQLQNYRISCLQNGVFRTRTCFSERDERSVPHNPAAYLCATHTHLRSSNAEYINIFNVLYFRLVRMSLSVLIRVTVLHASSIPSLF